MYFQVAGLSPYTLAGLVGHSFTEITDDVIEIATNLMKAYSNNTSPIIAFYTPSEIHLLTVENYTRATCCRQIPLDRSSINIHPLSGHWVTSYYNVQNNILCIYDSLMSNSHYNEVLQQLKIMYGNDITSHAQYVNVT